MAASNPRRLSNRDWTIPVLAVSGRRGARLRRYFRMGWVERRYRRSTHPDEPLLPPDPERALAAGAAHRVRRAFQLHAVAAPRAHGVFVAPLRGQASRIA